ncbi:hypothetical protein [Dyadobacter luticola]|uniref:hypothetical protein n=1 Tax=Dyadobacter luticola TaxID=1979387 RepID=UPI00197A8BD4|nr:hypothetical protein [Dyadobacter luticola]
MIKFRLFLLKTVTLFIPLLLLGLLEILLRAFDYGHNLDVFIKAPDHKGYLVLNKYASERYFSNQKNATIGNYEPFLEKKDPGTTRIFVLGESTTIGYPYMHNGSFHRWLQYRLMHTFPEKNFEIINLSLTAVNSWTVLDFAKTVVDYEPDAVLVYTGHNEYYGALGAGSGGNVFVKKVLIKLREFRLVQLLSNAFSGFGEMVSGHQVDLRENLMKRMAANQQISFGSKKYQAGIEQFKTNMDALCKLLSDRKIPLLLSNVVSNEKDLKPLLSLKGNAEISADQHYQAGNVLLSKGDSTGAKKEFVRAKELDVLRFRASEAINVIIEELVRKYPGITLVDSKTIFEKHSKNGILGSETLLEHVHPNLKGYGLLSESFYEALKKARIIPASNVKEFDFKTLQKQMPLTTVDSLKGAYEIMILKEGWPFNVPMPAEEKREKTLEEELAGALVVKQISWREAMNRLQNHYVTSHDTAAVLKVVEGLILENPLEIPLYDQAGRLSQALNQNEKAVTYLSHAFRKENSFERARLLFVVLLKMDKPAEALPYIQYAAANNQSRFNLNELLNFVQQLIAAKAQFTKDSTNVALSNQIALGYLKFANQAAAEKYVRKSLALDPKNAEARKMLGVIQAAK